MRLAPILIVLAGCIAGGASAKLPPLSDDAKAKAAEAAAKSAWNDKVAAYHLCQSMDRVADAYRKGAKTAGREAPAPVAAAPCVDPGPYAAAPAQTPQTPSTAKPLESSGAHSPSGTATSPPSTNATSAQMTGGPKK